MSKRRLMSALQLLGVRTLEKKHMQTNCETNRQIGKRQTDTQIHTGIEAHASCFSRKISFKVTTVVLKLLEA